MLFSCVLLIACSRSNPPSDGLIPKPLFTEVLLEATFIEARLNHEMVTEQRANVPMDRYYEELFREKGVSQADFERTFDHYAARPKEMATIYDDVLTGLRRRKDEGLQTTVPLANADTLATDSSRDLKR